MLPLEAHRQLNRSAYVSGCRIANTLSPVAPGIERREDPILNVATHTAVLQILNLKRSSVRADVTASENVETPTAVRIKAGRHQAQYVIGVEQQKERMVEDVEEVSLELQTHPLLEGERLDQRHIEAIVGVAVTSIANEVAVHKLEVD